MSFSYSRNSFIGRYWSLVHASLVACEDGGCGVSDVVDQSLVKVGQARLMVM